MALVAWTIIGIFVDAYFHATDAGLESFWTPWHALFYSGFSATSAWIFILSVRRRQPDGSLWSAAPLGYGAALVGIGMFGAGGVGDAIWHTVFGVETSLDALLSPTHLVLFSGALLIASAPFRAAWMDGTDHSADGWNLFLAPALSLILSAALVAFFFAYASLLTDTELAASTFRPGGDGEFIAAFGVLAAIVTTIILVTPILLTLRRWGRIPVGTVTCLTVAVVVLVTFGFDRDIVGLVPALGAGLIGEVLVARLRPLWFAAGYPLALWSLYFLAVARVGTGLGWPPEIWGGIIFFGVAVGACIQGLLSVGDRVPRSTPSLR